MKFLSTSLLVLAGLASSAAFAPAGSSKAFVPKSPSKVIRFMGDDNMFFAAKEEYKPAQEKSLDDMTLEEEIESLVQEDMAKKKLISKLKTSDGVDYAPWMNYSVENQAEVYQIMKEKAEARRRRKAQETTVSGNLYLDSQAQELSGTGLNVKMMGSDIELEWATREEVNTKGFIIKRRPAKTDDFEVIASYESWGPLASKGAEGGVYRYLDTDVPVGGWVYRITECDNNGVESDVCQRLVEMQSEADQKAAVIAAVGIAVLGVAAVAAGLLLDPMDGF